MNILFVCTGNTCRSAMAKALAEKIVKEKKLDCVADSAGVFADGISPASINAIKAVKKYGANLDNHISSPLTDEKISAADKIYAMTREHLFLILLRYPQAKDKTDLLNPDGDDIKDPYGGDEGVYDECAEQINKCLEKRLLCEK